MLYISTSVRVLCTPNTGQNMLKSLKRWEKARNLLQNLAKNWFFKFAPKRCWLKALFPEKTLDQQFNANLKKTFFCLILQKISCFFLFCSLIQKTLKRHILNRVWSAQHANTGQNIQPFNYNLWRNSAIFSTSKMASLKSLFINTDTTTNAPLDSKKNWGSVSHWYSFVIN